VKKIAILGAGSCGTALTIALGRSREPHTLSLVGTQRGRLRVAHAAVAENSIYLPGQRIPDDTEVTSDLAVALNGADIVLGVNAFRARARGLHSHPAVSFLFERDLQGHPPRQSSNKRQLPIFVSATKGIENES